MAYVDLATIQTIAAGQPFAAATLQQIRDNGEFLIDPPACSVFNSTAQSVPTSTWTSMTANSENFDNDSMHSTSSDTARITIQTAGRYLLIATIAWAASTAGQRAVGFLVNGTTQYGSTQATANQAGSAITTYTGLRSLTFAAGDYVECQTLHSVGSNHNTTLHELAVMFRTR